MILKLKVPRPEDFDEVFNIRIKKNRKIAPYDPALLAVFLNNGHQRARLFSLLCLNFGFTAIDIVHLMPKHITDDQAQPVEGGHFVTKPREKTSHQNDFASTHWMWPETKAALEHHRAASNPQHRYLMSKHGSPYHTKTVSGHIEQLIRDNGLYGKFSVKQFRKVGASQIKALGGSDAMHQYKSNAPSAVDAPYILEDYSLLTNALRKVPRKINS